MGMKPTIVLITLILCSCSQKVTLWDKEYKLHTNKAGTYVKMKQTEPIKYKYRMYLNYHKETF